MRQKLTLRLLLCFMVFTTTNAMAQSVLCIASGFWDDPLIWANGIVPSYNNSFRITIASGFHVTVRDARTVDGVVVQSGGMLTIASSGALTIAHDNGIDFDSQGTTWVEGILIGAPESVISSSSGSLFFVNGSVYRHQHTTSEGSIPLATWDVSSTVEIVGYTTVTEASMTGNWSQAFGNFAWNTSSLMVPFNLHGLLVLIEGSFSVFSTGQASLMLSDITTGGPLIVGSNFIISGSGNVILSNQPALDFTVQVDQDFHINTTGTLSFATDGIGRLVVGRDVLISKGTITESNLGAGYFIFQNGRRHAFYRGVSGDAGTISGRINYYVDQYDTLDLGTSVLPTGTGNGNANEFSLLGVLRVGSTASGGAIQNNTTAGNLRTAVSYRVFHPGSQVIYDGTAPQFIGNPGASTSVGTTTIIDNIFGVSTAGNTTVAGDLLLKRGLLFITGPHTLTLGGEIFYEEGALDGSSVSSLVLSGNKSGNLDLSIHPNSVGIGILTIDRSASDASVTIQNDVKIISQFNLIRGTIINQGEIRIANDLTLSRWNDARLLLKSPILQEGSRYKLIYRSHSIAEGPFAKFETGLELLDSPEALNSLVVNLAQSADTVVLNSNIVVQNQLDLNRGRFYIQHHTIHFKGTTWSDNTGNLGHGTGTVIFYNTTSIQGTSNAAFFHLQVRPESALTLRRNATLFGDLIVDSGGQLFTDGITLTFSGSRDQFISSQGATVGGIIMSKSNSSSVELLSKLNLTGLLRFNSPSSNINFKSNGWLTLRSLSDEVSIPPNTGMVYRLQNGNTISGDVNIERFMENEGRIYRYISSPVKNASVADWMDDFPVTGLFNDPSPVEVICGRRINNRSPNLFYYSEEALRYESYPQQDKYSSESPLTPGRGYAAFIRDCEKPTIIDVRGEINQQSINLPVRYTTDADILLRGWNLVGNPYPCTIDWDIISNGWIKTNISPVIAIRDNGNGGFFRYWDGDGDPSGIDQGRIAPGQAFWARATAENPILTIREGVKVTQSAEFFREDESIHLRYQQWLSVSNTTVLLIAHLLK
ncbi:MAG: hypothetical protein JNM57_12150 [Cyclobacteriaceae bacterium]|nr:hypothetical protein [Cyclobacteriaceae bacterium]